ncbi:MAG TPA: FAD-dependent oxidoreductase [Bryobacteraceae bacterium]|nr:FAD-dependent oxidoreductase [Bryobacteraceae bacterium]
MKIYRRDFLNNVLLGAGAALLKMPAPASAQRASGRDTFTGYGGVGDYAASNGDPWPVVSAGHKFAKGSGTPQPTEIHDTGETFDLLIVGGGLSGLGSAFYFAKATGGSKHCLILENHPIFGGHCKQNEFLVNGRRLIGPQASNDFAVPREGSHNQMDELFTELGLPREYAWASWDPSLKPLRIPRDNYSHMDGINDTQVDVGYFFGRQPGGSKPLWLRNIFANKLEGTPFSKEVRGDLLKWRATTGGSETVRRHLDAITYQQYLEGELGLRPEVTKFVEPVIGLICGASPDAVCARAGHNLVIPAASAPGISFPGGNTTFARHLMRWLIPDAIPGELSFANVLNTAVNFDALDRSGSATRVRLGATVTRVEHTNSGVAVTYEKDGKLWRTRGRKVVMASPGWLNRHILADLPGDLREAYDEFHYGPAMSVNVALTNWRFLYRLEAPAVRYFNEGFGWSCNIRCPMMAGSFRPVLHPDEPVVLTFYTGLYAPGHSVAEQGELGRKRLLETTYADYEKQIVRQMTILFQDAGFRASRDIAGVVLNRWGHARVLQPPGFYYGRDGKASPREIVQRGYGQIVIAHSELNGHQSAAGALQQAKRAAEDVLRSGA